MGELLILYGKTITVNLEKKNRREEEGRHKQTGGEREQQGE